MSSFGTTTPRCLAEKPSTTLRSAPAVSRECISGVASKPCRSSLEKKTSGEFAIFARFAAMPSSTNSSVRWSGHHQRWVWKSIRGDAFRLPILEITLHVEKR